MDEALNTYYVEGFLEGFLPPIQQSSDDLREFLYPFNSLYLYLKHQADESSSFVKWDQVPVKLLPHFASNLDFELLDIDYALESERRKLMRDVAYIYQWKGTKKTIEKIVSDLGFSYSWTEPPVIGIPFISNFHRTYSKDRVWTKKVAKDFSVKPGWVQGNYTTWWRVTGGKLLVDADGSPSYDDVIYYPETTSHPMRIEVKYEIISGTTGKIGFLIGYQDANEFDRVVIDIGSSPDKLKLEQRTSGGALITTDIKDLSTLSASEYLTGQHTLWGIGWGASTLGAWYFGIDDKTLGYYAPISINSPMVNKGLICDGDIKGSFDDYEFISPNFDQVAITFNLSSVVNKNYTLTLTGSPTNEANKRDFIKKIIPKYVPHGISVTVN